MPSDLAFVRSESISCPTTQVCEFAGGYVNTHGDDFTTAARLAAGKWTRQFPDNSGFDMDFQAISCPTAVTCEAVGSQSSFGLAERYS